MPDCKKCGGIFRDTYSLKRHMSRIRSCVGEKMKIECDTTRKNLQNPSLNLQNPSLNLQDPSLNLQNPSLNKCTYCLIPFYNKYTKNRHQEVCKFKEDPIRLLEINNKVSPREPNSKTECRFCNNDYSNVNNLRRHLIICKDRKEYHSQLLAQQEQKQVIQNIQTQNNNTNNGTINYNNDNRTIINVFGQESLEHVQTEKLIQFLRDLSKEYNKREVYLSAGEFINLVNQYIREIPENDNFVIKDHKSIYAEIKTPSGMKKVPIDRYLEKSFKSSAKTILDKKETINEHNELVFKSENNQEIFSEVKGFAKDGFKHTPKNCVGTPRQVRTSYKIGMFKNENQLNF
jgi:hypothetical protein